MSDVVRSKCSSSLRKSSCVAAVDSGDAAEERDIASADRMFVLSEVNSTLVNELDDDGVEWVVDVLPVQSVYGVNVMEDLKGILAGSHSAHQTCGFETLDRTVVRSSKSG